MADPRICLNCKHWEGLLSSGNNPRNKCSRIREVTNFDQSKAAIYSQGMEAEDGELWTAHDFGCTLFEANDD